MTVFFQMLFLISKHWNVTLAYPRKFPQLRIEYAHKSICFCEVILRDVKSYTKQKQNTIECKSCALSYWISSNFMRVLMEL